MVANTIYDYGIALQNTPYCVRKLGVWRYLFYELHQVMELTWSTINGMQPDISPTELYARLCAAEERWMSYRAAHCPETHVGAIINDEVSPNAYMSDEVELFERLMGHVKELMSITPA